MSDVLVIEPQQCTVDMVQQTLREIGDVVWTATSGREGLEFLQCRTADVVITTLQPPDMPATDLLRVLKSSFASVPVVVTADGSVAAVLSAIRLGVAGVLGKPLSKEKLLATLEGAIGRTERPVAETSEPEPVPMEPHAVARWANAIVPIIGCPCDPRTITSWGRCIAASPGAIRNWCFTAGIGPRQSLIFGRLLRAVVIGEGGRHKPENLLDVVDRRTLVGLLGLAGLDSAHPFPAQPHEFLRRQILVRDKVALLEVEKALERRLSMPQARLASR